MENRIPQPSAKRDIVGPEREDVTALTEREIVVRALDVVLWLKAGMRLELDALADRVTTLEEALLAFSVKVQQPVQPIRDKEASIHDFDPALAKLRTILKTRASNPADPMNEGTGAEIVERVAIAIEQRREQAIGLALWRAIKAWPGRVADEVVKHAITAIIVGSLAYIWHYLSLHR